MSISRNLSIFADTVATSGNAVSSVTVPVVNGSTTLALQTGSTGAMYIDASQNVGVGNTSPSYKLDVTGTARATTSVISPIYNSLTTLSLQTGGTTAAYFDASQNVGIGNTSPSYKLDVTGTARATTSVISPIHNSLTTLSLQTGGTTGLFIDASQNVGIGTTSPQAHLDVSGSGTQYARVSSSTNASFRGFEFGQTGAATSYGSLAMELASGEVRLTAGYSTYGGFQTFYTNGSERMRIDTSGNVLVGTTSSTVGAGTGAKIVTGTNAADRMELGSSSSANTGIGYSMWSTGAGAYRFYVGYGGTIYATSTTITAISDQRLKENIQDIDVGLNAIMALKPRKFDWKQGKGKDKKGDRGWIAQEFEQVFPEMVESWQGDVPDGEEPYKAVNADLIPILVAAMQEQQKLIQELSAEVTALKAKVGA